jgi:hypothetical protein
MQPDEMRKVFELCREFGVRTLTMGDTAVEFAATLAPADALKPKIGLKHGNPTDEELLMWSVPGVEVEIEAGEPQ